MITLAGAVLLATELRSPPLQACPPGPPNVVFLTADSLRADHTSLLGYSRKTTPNLERLAKDAVVYTNAQAQVPWTRPSYASLFTSLYDSDLAKHNPGAGRGRPGGYYNPFGIPDDVATLVTLLRESGYRFRTVGHAHNPNLSPDFNFHRGFERYDSRAGILAPDVVEKALDELDRQPGDCLPFFLFVHFEQTHFPYPATREFDRLWRGGVELDHSNRFVNQLMIGHGRPENPRFSKTYASDESKRELSRWLMAKYDRAIAEVDWAIGKIVDSLEQKGAYRNTLIIFNSDHGEEFYDHGEWGHGHQLYQESLHVPLLIKYPAGRTHEVSVEHRVVTNLDILPTVLTCVGIAYAQTAFAGRDLRSLESSGGAGAVAFSEIGPNRSQNRPGALSVRDGRYKLIRQFDDPSGKRFSELGFDLAQDPLEKHSLRASHPELARLRQRLDDWLLAHRGDDNSLPASSVHVPSIRAETLEELRALGYIDDTP